MDTTIINKGKATRQQIVESAYLLFLKQGYHATSMREIAREAGIALGGIYNHFSNKEEIFEAVFVQYHPYNQMIPSITQAQGSTVEELLRNIAVHMVAGLNENPNFLNLLFVDIVEFQSHYTQKMLEKEIPIFASVLQNIYSFAGPKIRKIPPLVLGRSFLGLFFSYFLTSIVLKSATNIPSEVNQDAFDHFVNIFLHGILNPENPPKGESL